MFEVFVIVPRSLRIGRVNKQKMYHELNHEFFNVRTTKSTNMTDINFIIF